MQMLIRVQIRLLHHVLDSVVGAQDRTHGAIDALIVAAHENLEKSRIAADDPRDDLFVADLFLQ